MKVIFFGTSSVAVPILDELIKNHQVLAVVTQPDKPVGRKQTLKQSGVALYAESKQLTILKPEKIKNNSEFLNQLNQFGADIFIVVSYGKILPEIVFNMPKLKTLNVHFSLLPKYRGPSPIQASLLAGEAITGTTIFILESEVDHGPILAQQQIAVVDTDTSSTLQTKLANISADLLIKTLPDYESGKIKPKIQDHEQASFCKMISKQDGLINWTDSAQQIFNQFRAYEQWPGIYTVWNNKKLKIIDCKVNQTENDLAFGEVKNSLVGCGQNSAIELITVQLEGKNPVQIKDFLNGYPKFNGSHLT